MPYFEMDMIFYFSFFSYFSSIIFFFFFNNNIFIKMKKMNKNLMKENLKISMNKNSMIFFLFINIFFLNINGIIPFFLTFSSHFFFSLNLSFFFFFSSIYMKIMKNKKKIIIFELVEEFDFEYENIYKEVLMNTKIIFFFLMKIMLMMIQFIILGLRLSMNITASHLIFSIFSKNIFFIFFFIIFEYFISFMQSIVFYLLMNMYML